MSAHDLISNAHPGPEKRMAPEHVDLALGCDENVDQIH